MRNPVFTVSFSILVTAAVLFCATPLAAQSTAEPEWSLAATGDSIITRRIAIYDDPAFMSLVAVIRDADVAFTNLELSLFRLWEFEGYPQAESGGNWEIGPPEAAHDLKWMGFELYNRANNHTTDYGVEGMVETNRLLDSLGLVHSGSGMNLGQANQAAYLDTQKGRFALIGLATTFTPMSRAGETRPDIPGRPGLNALRVEHTYQLDSDRMADWRRIVESLGGNLPESADGPVRFRPITFHPGAENKVISEVNRRDEERILQSIRSASRQADFVIVNSHSHDPNNNVLEPPRYIQEFAKKCLDAGADTFLIHGPHQLRGIEIYDGKPIFYSLGDFILQLETIEPMPDEMYERFGLGHESLAGQLYDTRFKGDTVGFPSNPVWYESVVAVPLFRGHRLVAMKLYPIDIGHKLPRPQRGTPRMAEGALAKKIIDHLASLSEPFGTQIEFENGIGIWKAAQTTSKD